ncbi:glycoside hydrolase family 127 protein [Novosphingobium piscinae]|uniref:glycoside hydrolase family 127 protein n=1 Tax=Novosphingobium piscinae TaxID=1507448 RepID=UPI001C8C50AB
MDEAHAPIGLAASRRHFLLGGLGLAGLSLHAAQAWAGQGLLAKAMPVDLAPLASASSSATTNDRWLKAIFAQPAPHASNDGSQGMWSTWPSREPDWIELRWAEPVTTGHISVFWAQDGWDVALPKAARLTWWDGKSFVPVGASAMLGVTGDRFNQLDFPPVHTDRLRLELTPVAGKAAGLLRWRVMSEGEPPALAPVVIAGVDRQTVLGGQTYLSGAAHWLRQAKPGALRWFKASGPGDVTFADENSAITSARFSKAGDYQLQLVGSDGGKLARAALSVRVVPPPPAQRLDVVYTTAFAMDNPLWNARYKALVVNWIPHCIAQCERTDLPTGRGGLDNFIEAAKALRGEAHGGHQGYVFSNAWVHQTVEAICLALMVDPRGDAQMMQAQAHMRATLERWIPIILAAQEPDGYLQTAFTLADRKDWPTRWNPGNRANHEGYVAGYFLESAINHYTLTGGTDRRLYDAARKLADCWVANIGPGKRAWFDGHQEMEQALVRFGRFVNDVEGQGRGDAYIRLARFLLDSREGGSEYDQSHLPPARQYEAVGHAVRAVYFYSGMADIAAETGDVDYQSAVMSLWDNMVNRKYYVTGGVGSGDTAEGFGKDYALKQDAYCESCSSCGLIFFQYKMNLAYHDAKYADLYEETMYNALLGSIDLDGTSFCYTNPLDHTERTQWHSCPCCVANIPRTLLMAPTWAYVKGPHALFVNLFMGSRIAVGDVAGTAVEVVQRTDYPWSGAVAITVNPAEATRFALHVRVPNRATSALYTATPAVEGLSELTVNGQPAPLRIKNGYAVIERVWSKGDTVAFMLPMAVQQIRASDQVEATRGQVALRYGPLVYAGEQADQASLDRPLSAPPSAVWRGDLLGGAIALEGQWADGSPLRAIPYFLRANRTGAPLAAFPIADGQIDFAPGTKAPDKPKVASAQHALPIARVWLNRT